MYGANFTQSYREYFTALHILLGFIKSWLSPHARLLGVMLEKNGGQNIAAIKAKKIKLSHSVTDCAQSIGKENLSNTMILVLVIVLFRQLYLNQN